METLADFLLWFQWAEFQAIQASIFSLLKFKIAAFYNLVLNFKGF